MREADKHTKSAPFRGRLEDELEWFFGYAEGARRLDRVAMLPSHAATGTSARAARPKAKRLARTVDECLLALPFPHAVVLRAVFTPRRWPKPVRDTFQRLSPIAVRLFGAMAPWPMRAAHQGLENAHALHLAACLRRDQEGADALQNEAQQLFESAMQAYADQRKAVSTEAR